MKVTTSRIIFVVLYAGFLLIPVSCKPAHHPFLVEYPAKPCKTEPDILVKMGLVNQITIPAESDFVIRSIAGDRLIGGIAEIDYSVAFTKTQYALRGKDLGKHSRDGVIIHSSKGIIWGDDTTCYPVRLVNVKGSSVLVYEVPFEQYVAGVTGSEMPQLWPQEALKAQAVASRSYALAQMARLDENAPYHVSATTKHQVYRKVDESTPGFKAAHATRGQVLVYRDKVLMAFYHSTSGGRTANAESVYDCSPITPLSSQILKVNENSPHSSWKYSLTWTAFAEKLMQKGLISFKEEPLRIEVIKEEDESANKLAFRYTHGDIEIPAREIRSLLGYSNVKSLWFNIVVTQGVVTFGGRGYGHRVGMSQYAAKQMAVEGEEYEVILLKFYPGTRLIRLYR